MEKFEALLDALNNTKIIQLHSDWAEDLPEDIWEERFKGNFTQVAFNLYPDSRRWYETAVSVIKIYGRFLGIRSISNIYSETMDYSDVSYTIEFFEMEEVMIKSYKMVDSKHSHDG